MWFLFIVAAIAYATKPYESAIYRNELRHLPEKLKQERIQETIKNTFTLIQDQIMQAAIRNETETNFTLFCLEPNVMQQQMNYLFRREGSTYKLIHQYEYQDRILTPLHSLEVKPRCLLKDGYELYNRHYEYSQPYQPDHPFYIHLDHTARNKPGIFRQNLEQEPILYIQQFFQVLNYQFPDLSLTISHERKGAGIFETDCCPVYIVSW